MPSRRTSKRNLPVAHPEQMSELQEEIAPSLRVCEIALTDNDLPFRQWLSGLRDSTARARIITRLDRILTRGNFGDHRERISGAVSELRIDHGPGYRVYYVRHGDLLVILIGGGTKDRQQDDIEAAVKLWEQVKDDVERYSRNVTS
jgi:putative addiction module killer protein